MQNTTICVPLRPISEEDFAPFGTLVEMGMPAAEVNDGTALRRDVNWFPAADARRNFALVTSIYDARPRDLPHVVGKFERHPNSPQLIVPLGGEGHAVIVCLSGPDGQPDRATVAAFRCSPRQGVIYRSNLWHHPIAALGAPAQFLVQSWQDATEGDCEIVSVGPGSILVASDA